MKYINLLKEIWFRFRSHALITTIRFHFIPKRAIVNTLLGEDTTFVVSYHNIFH